ncbi:non-ribosomal peptide synthetase [Actinacidiphila acididurans]|uniref:Non-ribosomal peptide synthetase n=1 Tax=Actinacidiphila acididurans TaxID=2784346 RepID=A0ABS2U0X6_9ACTN|nr:non-ribosomal peptide synthetase [Actinacidiphila acididurans]MBM9509253.1 non-ribosomal peptide synthetase [Actinacidiphila acididurans]
MTVETHSLIVRLPGGADRLPPGVLCWRRTAASPESVRAVARREAARPMHPAAAPVRRVLVTAGDVADLVIVADRNAVSRSRLEQGFEQDFEQNLDVVAAPWAATAPAATAVSWGQGVPGQARSFETVPVTGGEREFLAAAALVLACYEARDRVTFAVVPGADAEARLVTAEVSGRTVADLLAPPVVTTAGEAVLGVVVTSCDGPDEYVAHHRPPYPVTAHVELGGATIVRVRWSFTDLVHPATARRFADQVSRLAGRLGQVAPDLDAGRLDLLTSAETAEVLRLGDGGARPPGEQVVARRFREIAVRRPGAVALCDGTEQWTYARLDRESGAMAAGLRAYGVGPGVPVGICLDVGAALVVSQLAVLKAGGTYVPMDPGHPADRLRYLADDARLRLVIGSAATFPDAGAMTVVEPAELGREPAGPEPPAADDGARAAYVIYTSGSTGRPKGVVVPQRNVCALVDAVRDDLRLGPDDTWTLFHSSAFDFSVWEIWGCLLTGGRLVLVPYWTRRDSDEFYDLLVRERVTVLNQTPSAFAQLVRTDERRRGELALRLVVFGGEALNVRMLAPWFARHPSATCRIVNMFGITETTVHVTSETVTPSAVSSGSRSVGRALPGWSVSVRDAHGRVLPPGVPGEIVVGGAGVATGYRGRPGLTAQRFVAGGTTAGDRVYRSGDLGRLHPDGRLDHLGRLDHQVKVRGHRIELDEIRSVILDLPGVREAAVRFRAGDDGDGRIEAYAVLEGATTEQVLEACRRILPGYMVPSSVTALAGLPMTANGKVDMSALPDPAVAPAPAASQEGDDALAGRLSAIWAEVLKADVAMTTNFFTAGGTSLGVVRVLARMQERGLPKVPVRQFYRNSTLAQFVDLVRTTIDG